MIELYEPQEKAVGYLVSAFKEHKCTACFSSTGTGKTIMGLEIARRLKLQPLVCAPLAAHASWKTWSERMSISLADVVNIERLRTGKTRWVSMPEKGKYHWNLNGNLNGKYMVIVDECHKGLTGAKTATGNMIAMLRPQGIKTLLLTATPPANPLNLRSIGYLMGLHKFSKPDFFRWCRSMGCTPSPFGPPGTLEFRPSPTRAETIIRHINQAISDRMVKLTVKDLSSHFAGNLVEPVLVNLDQRSEEEINKIYEEMSEEVRQTKHANTLVRDTRARQRTELLKTPALAEMVIDSLEEGFSVFCAVGFHDTLDKLHKELVERGAEGIVEIKGGQSAKERESMVALFQSDLATVALATVQAGGISISLHQDKAGMRPRTSIICPDNSAANLTQALGRIHRAEGKMDVLQRIVLVANSIEQKIYDRIQQKLRNIDTLTDSDLSLLD